MNTLPPIGELAKLVITSYLACLAREGEVEQICFFLAQCVIESCPIPKNLGDVTRLLADIQKKWLKSCLEKLKLLKDRNIYEEKRKAIKNQWVFNIKSNDRYRSQLVVKEFSQIKGIDFDELFSLVVYYEIACLFLAVAALEDWDIHSIDVKTIYLYGNLDEKIYIEQPKGFRLSGKEKKVW